MMEMKRKDIVKIHGEAEAFATKVQLMLTKNEQDFLQEGIASKAIPQPQLLVKDHKEPNNNILFPTRLVIPATNFMATFSKLAYLGIKIVLDDKVNYSRFTIIQALDLKERLEDLKVWRSDVTMMLLDIENMHPLVRLKLIQRSLTYYLHGLSKEDKTTINNCLDLVKIGICNMLVQCHGKYYAYKGAIKGQVMGDEDVALAIGAYEVAFCADVVASHVFEMMEVMYMQMQYRGIYRDDGFPPIHNQGLGTDGVPEQVQHAAQKGDDRHT
eukprot:12034380-Ditylum_brightwellii.AAC.1